MRWKQKNSVEKFNIIELCDTAKESFEAFYIEMIVGRLCYRIARPINPNE